MSSKVDICNMALSHCSSASINAIDEGSDESEQCDLFYDTARQFVLSNSPWKFATKVTTLALLVEVPLQWAYAYTYPSDCLNIQSLLPPIAITAGNNNAVLYRMQYFSDTPTFLDDYKIPYETGINADGTQGIWTDEADAYVKYTFEQTDPEKLPAAFVTAFSHYLASLIAVPLAGRAEGRKIKEDELGLYQAEINTAIANNMLERYTGKPADSDMIKVRK